MDQHGLDAIVVFGSELDPDVAYFAGSSDLSGALIVKRRGQAGAIMVSSIERDNVSRSGLDVHLFDISLYTTTYDETGSFTQADLAFYVGNLDKLGVTQGRVALYGRMEVTFCHLLVERLKQVHPQLENVTGIDRSLIVQARATKDAAELARLIDVGRRTSAVMVATRDHIASHPLDAKRELFVKEDGTPLTVGDVKRFVRVKLLEHDLEAPEGLCPRHTGCRAPQSRGTRHAAAPGRADHI